MPSSKLLPQSNSPLGVYAREFPGLSVLLQLNRALVEMLTAASLASGKSKAEL